MSEDIAKIAAKLTSQQIEDVLDAPDPLQPRSLAAAWLYFDMAMVDRDGWTPLGLAVRAHLLARENGGAK